MTDLPQESFSLMDVSDIIRKLTSLSVLALYTDHARSLLDNQNDSGLDDQRVVLVKVLRLLVEVNHVRFLSA